MTCDRPICTECAVQAAVGFKCPDDARQSRAALAVIPTRRLASGIAAGTITAFVGGAVLAVVKVAFIGIILAYLLGLGVGEVTRRASGGYRDPILARAAMAAAALGILLLPLIDVVRYYDLYGAGNWSSFAFTLLAAIAAAFGANNRVNS